MIEIYKERFEKYQIELKKKEKRHQLLSIIRMVLFLFSVFFIVYLIESRSHYLKYYLFSATALFSIIFIVHEKVIRRKDYYKALCEINRIEIDKLHGLHGELYPGTEFMDSSHPYTVDLDIFGPGSLYQYINRAQTYHGKLCLADWLKTPETEIEIKCRQEAVKVLSQKIDWRQELEVIGLLEKESSRNPTGLLKWLALEPILNNSKSIRIIVNLLRLMLPVTYFLSFLVIPASIPSLFLIINLLVILFSEKYVAELYSKTCGMARTLNTYLKLFEHISNEDFDSEKLIDLKMKLMSNNYCAPVHIKKLTRLLGWLDLRKSMIHLPFNWFFLWDLYFVNLLEKWKLTVGNDLAGWIEIIGEFETLSSLSCLYYENPDWCFPEITDGFFNFSAKNLGHPLIIKEKRVCNDYKQGDDNVVTIITGSNMSGKSTFLRTIGVNMVLGLCGGPVCASLCSMSPVFLYTGMSSRDSLEKGVSSFYAELERIRMVLDAIESKKNIYMLFDEILKGTNSEDGHAGAVALLEQLIKEKVFCIIATHDLKLGDLEKSFEQNVANYCFNGTVNDGQLAFDYSLTDGLCSCRNAIALMRIMGINIPES